MEEKLVHYKYDTAAGVSYVKRPKNPQWMQYRRLDVTPLGLIIQVVLRETAVVVSAVNFKR